MVAFSKSKGVFSIRTALCLTMLTLSQVSHAQYFADIDYKRAGANRHDDDDDDNVSNVDKLNGSSNWMDFIHAHQKDFFQNAGGFGKLKEQWDQVYGLITKDPDAMRQNNRQHAKKGAMRSGDGTPDQVYQRQRMFEEKTRLETIQENKEPVSDIPTSNKLFELWLEQQSDRPGIRQDDKYDLVPHETLYLHAEDIEDDDDELQIRPDRPVRILKSSVNGDEAVINKLEEPYPTECFNHGKLAKQTQKYYMCRSLKTASTEGRQTGDQEFRVTNETYSLLLSQYSDQYSCYTKNVENNVCVCPQGVVDYVCATDLYTKCYINITEPAFYKGCENEFEDSFYYLYSVPGFSPCFWQNFSSSIDVEFTLNCQQIETTGLVSMATGNDVGYPYRDVIQSPNMDTQTQVSASSEIEFIEDATTPARVTFDFRDMKYLSAKEPFSVELDVKNSGQTTGSVPIDFSILQKSDATGDSRYIVGGRTYFEASVFGDGGTINSFTFRGFFDEEGYEEPKSTLNKLKSSGWLWVIIGSGIALVILAIVLYCYCQKKKEQEKQAKKHKHD